MTPDAAWWASLDDAWRAVLVANVPFEGEPTPAHLQRMGELTHLYAAKSPIESFAPLTGLALTQVDFSGCKSLTSFDGLPPTVETLTFHWMAMEDISWVDALPNLQEVYCDKPLQGTINRRIKKNRKKRAK